MRRLIDQDKRREQAEAWYRAYLEAKHKLRQPADASHAAKSDARVPMHRDSAPEEPSLDGEAL